MKSHIRAGQFKLRGKKEKVLSCGCCVVRDLRDSHDKRNVRKDIEYALDDVLNDVLGRRTNTDNCMDTNDIMKAVESYAQAVAGQQSTGLVPNGLVDQRRNAVEKAVIAAIEAEREACAKVCEAEADAAWSIGEAKFGDVFAHAIRGRSTY